MVFYDYTILNVISATIKRNIKTGVTVHMMRISPKIAVCYYMRKPACAHDPALENAFSAL